MAKWLYNGLVSAHHRVCAPLVTQAAGRTSLVQAGSHGVFRVRDSFVTLFGVMRRDPLLAPA